MIVQCSLTQLAIAACILLVTHEITIIVQLGQYTVLNYNSLAARCDARSFPISKRASDWKEAVMDCGKLLYHTIAASYFEVLFF